jgi:RND superfamily putative drug exporter
VLTDERELDSADEATYRKLVEALSRDQRDVVMVQDFIGTPSLREFMTSKDNKAWVLPVGLTGALGTPESYAAFNRVSEIVRDTTAASALDVHLAGPAATVADLTVAGQRDRLPIETAIAVMVLLVLLVVYRNPVAMLLPLTGIGISLVIAQSAVAGLSEFTGFGVSNQAIILLSAMIAGAGTDYAVFLISRYHDYVRRGKSSTDAVRQALTSVGKVITASAATIGVTFLAISFAQMGVFSTVGVSSAIGPPRAQRTPSARRSQSWVSSMPTRRPSAISQMPRDTVPAGGTVLPSSKAISELTPGAEPVSCSAARVNERGP